MPDTIVDDKTTSIVANELLAAALEYAGRGWRVMPLYPIAPDGGCPCESLGPCKPGKHPRISDWQTRATVDPKLIREWWRRWPDAGVGIVMGAQSGVIALDVDPRNGGDESLVDLKPLNEPSSSGKAFAPAWVVECHGGYCHGQAPGHG